jgi:hypothetical protein
VHITITRRSRLRASARLGIAVLTAAVATAGLAAAPAAADEAPRALAKASAAEDFATAVRPYADARIQKIRSRAAVAAVDPTCMTPKSGTSVLMTRFAGANRYQTAVCSSLGAWADHDSTDPTAMKAKGVVLARGDAFPDALAGGPLAGYVDGPLLLSPSNALPAEVRAEIDRVLGGSGTVYLLGGTLSSSINNALRSAGYQTKRLAGANRYETAIAIAREMRSTNLFFVTTGMNYPDALAAGAFSASYTSWATWHPDAADDRRPYALLFTNNAAMPSVTANFIVERANQFPEPGTGYPTVLLSTAGAQGDRAVRSAFNPEVIDSYVGANRYATATIIADQLFTSGGELTGAGVGLANGMNFPDALAGTSTLMNFGQPLLLTTPTTLQTTTRSFLVTHRGDVPGQAWLDLFGGTGVISTPVANAAFTAFGG